MLTQESTTKAMIKTMEANGFDIQKDQIMNYTYIELQPSEQYREAERGGGILTDWNLKSSLDGLYAAGSSLFSPEDHSFAAATGRYAGRKAAAYANTVDTGAIDRGQIDKEKERVLAPTKIEAGMEWKELHNGLCRVMQYFAGEFRNEQMFDIALDEIGRIEENAVPELYALDPHKLMRSVEVLSLIQDAKIVLSAMKERRFTNAELGISRVDYPENDEEDQNKYLTLTFDGEKIKFDRIPIRYWGNMKEEYEAHNKDYTGVYKPEN